MITLNKTQISQEFDRQANNLIQKGYPETANLSKVDFLKYISPLKKKVQNLTVREVNLDDGFLPFGIVVKSNLVPTEKAMSLIEREGRSGITKLYPHKPKDFQVISDVSVPEKYVYLLIDIARGKDYINLPPNEALKMIVAENRSPLSIDEGVAILTQFPDYLKKNNCFSLLASRHQGDKRVPAIWINSKKEPNLGWCWEGNPHTWLGSASCKYRI